jgi:hypothetical protein
MTPKTMATAPTIHYRMARFAAAIFMLLMTSAVAAEEIKIGGSGATLGTIQLLAEAELLATQTKMAVEEA